MGQKTPLFEAHQAAGAKIVDFAGWDMPVNYGSQIEEHHAVRKDAGMFDVSHMCAVDISGPDARTFMRTLLANDVDKAPIGKAIYSCMLNEQGGVVDDLITYVRGENNYRTVVNAGTAEKDLAWMNSKADELDVSIKARRDLGIVAVQGPNAREKALPLVPESIREAAALPVFGCTLDGDAMIGRTGYTGEDGFECIIPVADLKTFWDGLIAAGVHPCGLGARDTLRLEAGMNLYGQDMDESVSPLAAGLAWTVAWEPADRQFMGRDVLEEQRATKSQPKFVALVLQGRGIMRGHQKVICSAGEGELTSGGFSPTMEKSIGLARIPRCDDTEVQVEIRGKLIPATVVKAPFVRNGQVKV